MSNDDVDDFDELIEEIKENARRDRNLLTRHLNDLMESEASRIVPDGADSVTKAVDALTRVNSQLVAIASIKAKRKQPSNDFSDEEKDDLYQEVGNPFDKNVS